MAVLHTSIKHGTKKGIQFTLGVFISDVLMILAVQLLSNPAKDFLPYSKIITNLGAIVFILYGLYLLITTSNLKSSIQLKGHHFLLAGFIFNTVNPANLLGWASTMVYLISGLKFEPAQALLLLFSFSILILIVDLIFVYLSYKHSQKLGKNTFNIFQKVIGLVFLVLGLVLLF